MAGADTNEIIDFLDSVVCDLKEGDGDSWYDVEEEAADPKPPADDEPDDEGFEENDDEFDQLGDEARNGSRTRRIKVQGG